MPTHANAVNSIFPTMQKDCTNDVTLTNAEAANASIIKITASGTSKSLILPAAIDGKMLIVYNAGANAVTVKVTGQTGVAIATTKTAILRCNDTDILRVTADA